MTDGETESRVCDVIEELMEEVELLKQNNASGKIYRVVSERIVDERSDERACVLAYMRYHSPEGVDPVVDKLIADITSGAHRR